jgi:hypothetical protein
MNKTCEICGKDYEAKRATSRYCSPKCRVQAGRVSVTKDAVSVTSKPVSVTNNDPDVTVKVSVTPLPRIDTVDELPSISTWEQRRRARQAAIDADIDNPLGKSFDLSEEGFRRRNKAWDTFKPEFRAMIMDRAAKAHEV